MRRMTTPLLWRVVVVWACMVYTLAEAQVQAWNSANSVAGELLVVANFTDHDKQVRTPRHSYSSQTKSRKSKSSKTSKSDSSKSSKASLEDTGSRPSSTSRDSSKGGSESRSTGTKSETRPSDSSGKDKDSPSKSSSRKTKRSTSSDGSTNHDRPSSSEDSDNTRDPSKTSEDTESDSETMDTPSKDSEDVTPPSEDSEDDTPLSEDSEDDTPSEDSEDDTPSEGSEDDAPSKDSEDEPTAERPTMEPTIAEPTSYPPTTSDTATNEEPTMEPTKVTEPPSDDNKDNIFDSQTPTASPTYGPTAAPLCELNALGAYGGISDDRREYEYFYQIETTSDVTQSVLTDDLMGPLEKEIGTRIVATLFDECRPERRVLQDLEDSNCDAVGFSRLPVDRPLAGGKTAINSTFIVTVDLSLTFSTFCCTVPCLPGSRQDESNICYAVDGGVRMFFDGECENADSVAMATIRKVVDDGDYSRTDPRIINVIYLDISDIDLDQDLVRTESAGSSSWTKVPGWAIIILTVVSLGLVVSLLMYLGKKKPQDKNGFDIIPDDEEDGEY